MRLVAWLQPFRGLLSSQRGRLAEPLSMEFNLLPSRTGWRSRVEASMSFKAKSLILNRR